MKTITSNEKLDWIIKALYEAKLITAGNDNIRVYPRNSGNLKKLEVTEISTVLHKLEADDKILEVISIAKRDYNYIDSFFEIRLSADFDTWYNKWLLEKKSSVENLDYLNLLKIYDVVLDIEQAIQLANKCDVSIPALPHLVRFPILFPSDSIGMRNIYTDSRWEAVSYLKNKGILSKTDFISDDLGYANRIDVTAVLPKFEIFKEKISSEYIKRNEKNKKDEAKPKEEKNIESEKHNETATEVTEVARFEATYVKNRISVNGRPLGKTTFSGENDLVFDLVYKHPNKTYTKKQVEEEIKQELKKDLDKIVENLGFVGELRKAFFDVSSKAIRFRNPVTDTLIKTERLSTYAIKEALHSPKQS